MTTMTSARITATRVRIETTVSQSIVLTRCRNMALRLRIVKHVSTGYSRGCARYSREYKVGVSDHILKAWLKSRHGPQNTTVDIMRQVNRVLGRVSGFLMEIVSYHSRNTYGVRHNWLNFRVSDQIRRGEVNKCTRYRVGL